MGQTATPNSSAPATPVTSTPASEYSMVGSESIAQAHPSDARAQGGGSSGPIDVIGTDGALRL